MANTNGTYKFTAKTTKRTFKGACPRASKPVKVASGQILKGWTLLESTTTGEVVAHSGMVEKALVTMPTKIDATETQIIAGLTFTATAQVNQADLVKAWSGLTAGMTNTQANTLNPITGGSFTAGTFTGYNSYKSSTANSVLFVSTTPNAGVTDLTVTGTGDASTVAVTSVNSPIKPVVGILCFDVDASSAAVDATAWHIATVFDEALIWNNNPASDTITLSDLTTKAVTDYYTGATTKLLKLKLLEGSDINVIIPNAGEM